jgi:hypothetical protein
MFRNKYWKRQINHSKSWKRPFPHDTLIKCRGSVTTFQLPEMLQQGVAFCAKPFFLQKYFIPDVKKSPRRLFADNSGPSPKKVLKSR